MFNFQPLKSDRIIYHPWQKYSGPYKERINIHCDANIRTTMFITSLNTQDVWQEYTVYLRKRLQETVDVKNPVQAIFSQPSRCKKMITMRLPRRAWKWYMRCLENHPWKTQLISTGLSDPIHAVVLIELTFTLYSCLMIFQYKMINP